MVQYDRVILGSEDQSNGESKFCYLDALTSGAECILGDH